MKTYGLPEEFFIVTKPSPGSTLEDILFPCTFSRLMNQVRGGLNEDEIVGIYADEDEARAEAMVLLGKHPVRPQDALIAEVVVNVTVMPKSEEMTAKELSRAAVEAVSNAVRIAEERGHQHRLADRVSLGMSEVVELKSMITVVG